MAAISSSRRSFDGGAQPYSRSHSALKIRSARGREARQRLPYPISVFERSHRSHRIAGDYPFDCPCRKSNPNVLVMQTTKVRLCEDPTDVLNFAWNRRVFVQRQMRAGLVVICHVGQQYAPKVTLAKHDDVIECLPPDRANQAFGIGVLPGRSRCSWSVANAHRAKPPDECLSIIAIAIANDIVL